eukprot:3908330-Amphidinium_carterae.1
MLVVLTTPAAKRDCSGASLKCNIPSNAIDWTHSMRYATLFSITTSGSPRSCHKARLFEYRSSTLEEKQGSTSALLFDDRFFDYFLMLFEALRIFWRRASKGIGPEVVQ